MTSLNRPARLNRTLLALIGLILIAAGGFAVATHLGRLGVVAPDSALVPRTGTPPTWALYATAAVAIMIGLLVLRWLLAQLARKPKSHTWRFESDADTGRTELASSTAIQPFLAEVSTYTGVHTAHATLAGTRDAPALVLVVTAEQDSDPSAINDQIEDEGLPRLRQALDLDAFAVSVEFRFSTKAGARTI